MSSRNPLGSFPHADSWNHTQKVVSRNGNGMYFQTPETNWLAYTKSLTKCVSSELFTLKKTPLLCILVHVIPQGLICNGEEGRAHLNLDSGLLCAQWVITILILLVGAGKRDSTAVGKSALVMGDKNLKESSAQADTGPSPSRKSWVPSGNTVRFLSRGTSASRRIGLLYDTEVSVWHWKELIASVLTNQG